MRVMGIAAAVAALVLTVVTGVVAGFPIWWFPAVGLVVGAVTGVPVLGRAVGGAGVAIVAAVLTVVATATLCCSVCAVRYVQVSGVAQARAQIRDTAGTTVCLGLTRRADHREADAAAADRVATGAFAAQLTAARITDPRSTTSVTCVPVRAGVVRADRHSADALVAVNLTESGSGVRGEVVTAHLLRIDGRWRIERLDTVS
ncbi:hypothetical protein SAMN05445060_2988 [Williamsia sterculiae]|uniref:Mce-associated membrane protein n=2 Tax=Williamsia sterculiae TaxID=1344003 RepID=A0A1N7GQD6_9NOCA|nr:hypothetical protein SAMN05445060_2988 [Williamsia sterculiae]